MNISLFCKKKNAFFFYTAFFLTKRWAMRAPEILCQTLKTAPGTEAMARAENCEDARLQASPEFCIPTSTLNAVDF